MRLALLLLLVPFAAAAQTIEVAAVQFRSTFDIERNAARIVETLDRLAARKVQVAVFPECALTGYTTDASFAPDAAKVEKAEQLIAQACKRGRIGAIVGSVYKSGDRTYNAAVVFNENGEIIERYGKLQLAGEKWATPGNHMALFELAGVKSTVIICHDERYPEFVRLPALAGAKMIYYISHESGMQQEQKLPGYKAQMMARAVENGMYVVAANAPGNIKDGTGSHGQSRIIHEDGRVLQEASFYGEDILLDTLTIKPGKLTRPLEGVTGKWWKQGLDDFLANRHRKLD